MSKLEIVQSIQRMACPKCHAETNAPCSCGLAYEVIVEDWARKKEQSRQRQAAYDERKRQQKQQTSDVRNNEKPTKSKAGDYSEKALDECLESNSAAERAEARCNAKYKAFTAQEERNAVNNILEAIRDLTDDQRALLFQTLKDSYQWTT